MTLLDVYWLLQGDCGSSSVSFSCIPFKSDASEPQIMKLRDSARLQELIFPALTPDPHFRIAGPNLPSCLVLWNSERPHLTYGIVSTSLNLLEAPSGMSQLS